MSTVIEGSLIVVYQTVSTLVSYPHSARTHSNHQIRQIARSITEFGFTNPILIDRDNTIIAGHGRLLAAQMLGMERVPTIRLETLTQSQIRAYVLADNQLALNAGWEKSILATELEQLLAVNEEIDITVTGFEIPQIDLILQDASNLIDPQDELPIDEASPAVSQPGDVWQLGKHRVLCGNSLQENSYKTLIGGKRAAIIVSDLPYNVRIDGHVCGNGSIQHREFEMASGEMSEAEFIRFLSTSLRLFAKYSVSGSIHYLFIDWRHLRELLAAGDEAYDSLLNLCVWVKDNGGMGSFYRSQHELILVFKNGNGPHRNNVQLGKFGRYRTNVWEYPGISTMSKQGDEGNLLALHPTVKPVQMIADAILDASARGEIVLDGFLGSGSTLLAAERVSRICYVIEIDPLYVDVAIRRWQRYTGDQATLQSTGKTYNAVASTLEVVHG
jgi:DNA modification methylase